MSAYLHAAATAAVSHPFLTIAALWAFLAPFADRLPENRE